MVSPGSVAFSIGGIDIMWYGILIAAGALLACIITYARAPRFDISRDKLLDVIIISIVAGIIGARLYYVIFNWNEYAGNLLRIINLRGGGLAIHGGLIAGLGVGAIMCKKWKIDILDTLDVAIPSIALAQAIGRWGNFFNSEAHGGPTDLPWGVYVSGVKVHPTFLYESIWCFILFIVLSIILMKHRKFKGQILLLYGMLYSLERFFVEALRTDSLMIGPFKQAQVLSLTVIIICAALYVILRRKRSKNL